MCKKVANNINEPITFIVPMKNVNASDLENLKLLLNVLPNKDSRIIAVVEDSQEKLFIQLKKLEDESSQLKIVISGKPGMKMGKAHNMLAGYSSSECEITAFKDADVRVTKESIADLYHKLIKENAGGGFAPSFYLKDTYGAELLLHIVSNNYFNEVLFLLPPFIKLKFCNGAFMMFRRSALEASGGLHSVQTNITDDASLGKILAEGGYKIVYSDSPVFMISGRKAMLESIRHIYRWLIIVKSFLGRKFVFVPLTFYTGNIVLLAFILLLSEGISVVIVVILAIVFIFKIYTAYLADNYSQRKTLNFSHYLLAAVLGIFQPYIWISSLFMHNVKWAGRKYRVGRGGKILSVKEMK